MSASLPVITKPADVILTTQFGKFKLHLVSGTNVSGEIGNETGPAYHNSADTSAMWKHRDGFYLGTVYFTIAADGAVVIREISIAKQWQNNPAPRTYSEAMADAMAKAIAVYLADHPAELVQAERAMLRDRLRTAIENRDKIAETLDEADRGVSAIRTKLADLDTRNPAVSTWADGFGVWHVRVSANAASPLIAARRALRDELTPRVTNLARSVWLHPQRVPDLDTENTIVYRENPGE